jgi:hypothetical protein
MRGVWGYGLILRAPKPPWPLVAAKEFFSCAGLTRRMLGPNINP